MALESVSINEGTQTPIASDNIAGTAYQVMKVNLGGDGTVGVLWDGNVNVTSGTTATNILSGTINSIPNIPGGTVGLVSSVGTVPGIGVVSNLTNGSVRMTVGTVTVLPDLPGGTIDVVSVLSAGTVQINPKPTRSIIAYGTTIGGTAATGVTLLAAPGAGTSIYLNEISVVNQGTAALTCHIGFGTASTPGTSHVLGGVFAANGGIQKSYPTPVGGHIANLALLGSVAAAGTVNVNLSYWVE